MSDEHQQPTTADVLMMAGQVIQGLRNAKTTHLRDSWVDWAVEVVEHMGRLIHASHQYEEVAEAALKVAYRAEFILALIFACAENRVEPQAGESGGNR